MKMQYLVAAVVLFLTQMCSTNTQAQSRYYGTSLVPSNPSSADSINFLRVERASACRRLEPNHKIAMVNNSITITFAEWDRNVQTVLPPPDSGYTDLVSIGRLPPGDYALTTVGKPCSSAQGPSQPELTNFAFKVSDAKLNKPPSSPVIDYSGHWWDEANPGWGLFIWQDAADNTLAAWLSYTPDGKPAWYVFQPKWAAGNGTYIVDLWLTSKPPGVLSPLTGDTKFTKVGSAALQFYFGNYSRGLSPPTIEEFVGFFLKLGESPAESRTLMRFKVK